MTWVELLTVTDVTAVPPKVFLAFGLPWFVWSAAEEWASKSNSRGVLLLVGAGFAFALRVINTARLFSFIEGHNLVIEGENGRLLTESK